MPQLMINAAEPVVTPKTGYATRSWYLFFQQLAAFVNQLVNLSTGVTGTLNPGNGGSGASSLTAHAVLVGEGTSPYGVAGPGAVNTVLHGQGAASDPTFSAVDLAADVTGDLPLSNLTPASAASRLLGRGSAAGAGDYQELTLGSGVTLTGTVLSATGSGGSVTTTGTPASGNLTQFSGATAITNGDLTGEVTTSGTLAATVSGTGLTNDGNSGTALALNFQTLPFSRHVLTLTGNVTLTLTNPKDGGDYLILIDTGAGGFTVTWPAAVTWPGGVAPVITVAAAKVDVIRLVYRAGTTSYYGAFWQNY